jgi:phage baseplate assembly protein W
MMSDKPTWTDLNGQVGINGKPFILTDADDIHGSIYNILRCPIGSRGWNPTFGSILPILLWRNISVSTASAIRIGIIQAIRKWEKRITIIPNLTTVAISQSGSGYDVQVGYTIVQSGITDTASFSFLR